VISRGQSKTLSFAESGIYDYICSIHPSMKGKIVVK
jgi:plastocyanin